MKAEQMYRGMRNILSGVKHRGNSTGVRYRAQRARLPSCEAPHSGRNEVTNRPKILKLLPDSQAKLRVIKDNKAPIRRRAGETPWSSSQVLSLHSFQPRSS